MAKVNLRSPYHIYYTSAGMTRAVLELYIYTGVKVGTMPSITYTIDTTAYNDKVTFEISELIRDYLDITFGGTYTSQTVFCNYRITRYVGATATVLSINQLECLDGYGYFDDGVNSLNNQDVLQSNSIVYRYDMGNSYIPIFADVNKTATYYNDSDLMFTSNITASTDTSTQIIYLQVDLDNSYKNRVLVDGGTYEESQCLLDFLAEAKANRIVITNGSKNTTINIENISECKYAPYKITFINKFGALQDVWFFKRSDLSLNLKDEKYNSNTLVDGAYSISAHQNRVLSKQGTEKLSLNSGFYVEEYNEVFRQMMLSEKVWIEIDSKTLPINIASSSFDFKTRLNDKLINYKIDVEFAFNKINSIR